MEPIITQILALLGSSAGVWALVELAKLANKHVKPFLTVGNRKTVLRSIAVLLSAGGALLVGLADGQLDGPTIGNLLEGGLATLAILMNATAGHKVKKASEPTL